MTDIAVQPLQVATPATISRLATVRLTTVRLAVLAFAVVALIAASFAIGRVTSSSHATQTTTNTGTSVSVPAGNLPGVHGVQQPALGCPLHGPC
jgi:hypothetical protein